MDVRRGAERAAANGLGINQARVDGSVPVAGGIFVGIVMMAAGFLEL